eukprot:212756-Prymnesium_polylepis.2
MIERAAASSSPAGRDAPWSPDSPRVAAIRGYGFSHASLARFTGKGLWASERTRSHHTTRTAAVQTRSWGRLHATTICEDEL